MKIAFFITSVCLFSTILLANGNDPNRIYYEGHVVDENGNALSNAVLDIYNIPTKHYIPYFAKHVGSVTSGSDGWVYFSRHKDFFNNIWATFAVVKVPGHPVQLLDCSKLKDNPKVIIPLENCVLAGQIVDSNNKGIVGVKVCAFFRDLFEVSTDSIPEFVCMTDEDGSFQFDSLPPKVRVGIYAHKESYGDVYTFRTDKRDYSSYFSVGKKDVKVVLKKHASLSGQLSVEETGQSLSGDHVYLKRVQAKDIQLYSSFSYSDDIKFYKTTSPNCAQCLTTNANGQYHFNNLIPGTYYLFHHNKREGLYSPMLKVTF